ncbi:MAG TPA: FAD-binding oxidoreductase, partial [Longimicrobiaceae bacterium]|nr:FAD-binding oxidoreductase [Longimicrobiaceae bacterium]
MTRESVNSAGGGETVLNDVHSRLNPTRVRLLHRPTTVEEVQAALRQARADGLPVAICGGRHAMGGQQFCSDGVQLDMSGMNRVLWIDHSRRTARIEAGAQWPEIVSGLQAGQIGVRVPLTFRQKQTGADQLSLGGALAANVHGRGLRWPPFVSEIASFLLVDGDGDVHRCSRRENPDLFRLAIGGYGLFGVVVEVELRLVPRRPLERVVEITTLDDIATTFEARNREDFEYGDFQFMTDATAEGFMNKGVLSCYRPVQGEREPMPDSVELRPEMWKRLLHLAHVDKASAFELYAGHYRATHGQVYASDLHQLGTYVEGYHEEIDAATRVAGSEMITELYVPRDRLTDFMQVCRSDFREHGVDFIYGTIRLIEEDEETFLPWARRPYACVIFNLHVAHDEAGVARAIVDFKRLIDRALERGGSFYLTYHRWATREQLLQAYPELPAWLAEKRRFDPEERFQSDWY